MDINEKREYARKLHRAAGNKVSRNTGKGIKLAGSDYDVRRDVSKIKRYNGRQLDKYISELQSFTSRKTQFVPDAYNKPLPADKMRAYKKLENKNRDIVNSAFGKVANLFNPISGMTLKQRMENMMPDRLNAGNRRVNAAYQPVERSSKSITSLKSLEKLTRDMEKRIKPGNSEKNLRIARRSFNKMLKQMNNPELSKLAKSLTQDQFNVVWQYTTLPDMADYNYQAAQDQFSGHKNRDLANIESVVSDNQKLIKDVLGWGKTINVRG